MVPWRITCEGDDRSEQEDLQEETVVFQAADECGLEQAGDSKDRETWMDSKYIWEVESTKLAECDN